MANVYPVVLIIASIALAFLTSTRIAYVLAGRWNFKNEPTFFFSAACGIVAGVVMGFVSYALIATGGLLFGLIGAFASVPLVGIVWLFVVGGNKAIERILGGLLAKVS